MENIWQLRNGIIALVAFAGVEDEMLLATAGDSRRDGGSPQRWAARPLVAHNTEFKRQQVRRLKTIRRAETPPSFAEIDHGSDEVYRRYSAQDFETVAKESRATTRALIDEVATALEEDLVDPSRTGGCKGASSGCRSSSAAFGTRQDTSLSTTCLTEGPMTR